jgi:cation-transporting ATPase E
MTSVTSSVVGLSEAEVAQRVAAGQTNDVPNRASRSVSEIVRSNVFTRINAILGVLFAIVLSTGSLINGLFGLLIIANSGIGIIQELRAKKTLDNLAIVSQSKPTVRRSTATGSVAKPLAAGEVVLDDVIELGPGDQIVVDGELLETASLEVDESLLTGEADPIAKAVGDPVMSGSFVSAGSGAYRATKVGREAYAARLAEEASKFTLVKSELRSGINKILRFITYLLWPAGLLTIYSQLFTTHVGWQESLLRTVGALVPMVPEGLVLMTSIAFAVGVIRLGQRQCLVQELPAIEGLARVDVVCADKTGTLTENGMRVSEVLLPEQVLPEQVSAEQVSAEQVSSDRVSSERNQSGESSPTEHDVRTALAALACSDPKPNASMQAIAEACPERPDWTVTATAPFKSATKWSGASFGAHGNWVLGAPDVLLEPGSAVADQAEAIGSQGLRVLLLGSSQMSVDSPSAPGDVLPAALVVLEQRIRPDARDTLDYFASQHVSIKVISGDNAVSVGAVAAELGLSGETMDARRLPDDMVALAETMDAYTTFGRVRPDQKRAMVHALQSRSHTVAMTGDGVNDVLALKDADIGVAMGAGSPASRAVAQIVLLDNKFATLPYVVGEGRRVIGNIERVSNLFLTKTVYSVLLALLVGITGVWSDLFGTEPLLFPFQPIHVTIAAWFTIGIPAFILSLAPNNERARRGFVRRVMMSALPSGTVIGLATFGSYLFAYHGRYAVQAEQTQASTAALITLLIAAIWVLAVVARPYQWWRVALVAASGLAYVAIFATPWTRKQFMLDPTHVDVTLAGIGFGLFAAVLIEAMWWIQGRILGEPRKLWLTADPGQD